MYVTVYMYIYILRVLVFVSKHNIIMIFIDFYYYIYLSLSLSFSLSLTQVYLHFILSALINRLTHTKQVDGNPLLPPLTGLVDECLVSVAISVLIMQYLLCYTPVMETDTPTDKESEGHAQLHERERVIH